MSLQGRSRLDRSPWLRSRRGRCVATSPLRRSRSSGCRVTRTETSHHRCWERPVRTGVEHAQPQLRAAIDRGDVGELLSVGRDRQRGRIEGRRRRDLDASFGCRRLRRRPARRSSTTRRRSRSTRERRPHQAFGRSTGASWRVARARRRDCASSISSRASRMSPKPTAAILLEAPAQHSPDAFRRVAGQARPVRLGVQHRGYRLRRVVAVEGSRAGEHLEQHGAERPDVGAAIDRLAARLLGAHVGRGAQNHTEPVIAGL